MPEHPGGAGAPGSYPFTGGLYATGYTERLWTMRQYAGEATAQETNERFRFLLASGQTGLSVAFDLPTQIGLDPDDPMAEDDVGKVGVSVATVHDMEVMFDRIPLDSVSTSMTINATAPVMLAMYLAVAKKQGVPWEALRGTLQNDLLKEFVARGTYRFPIEHSMRLATDLITFCAKEVPRFNAISVSGYHMREAGCDAIEEAAFAVAFGKAYLDRCIERGLSVDDVAPRMSWIFNTHNDILEEVAKYRALRTIWATTVKEEYGAQNPKSWMLRTHTQTGGSTLPAQQPENNIARAALQALAAALGGVQSMALSCYDEAIAIPTRKAQQIALRTQQIIAHESGITAAPDPLAGSYVVEHLTQAIIAGATGLLAEVKAQGGAEAAVASEWMQARIAAAADRHRQAQEAGEEVIVGVNRFTEDVSSDPPPRFELATDAHIEASKRLAAIRAARDEAACQEALASLQEAAKGTNNLVPLILAAVEAEASVGEVMGALEAVWGQATASTLV